MPNTEKPNTPNSGETVSLNEWMEMDQATREQLAQKWLYHDDWMKREEWKMGRIVQEAAKSLSRRVAGCADVTGVEGINPGMILVTTSLCEGQKVTTIPEEWATFPVRQFGVGERKKAYMWRLEFALRAARINRTKMEETLAGFDEALRAVPTPLYADTPDKWIAQALAYAVRGDDLFGGPLLTLIFDLCQALADHSNDADLLRGELESAPTSTLHRAFQRVFSSHGVRTVPPEGDQS